MICLRCSSKCAFQNFFKLCRLIIKKFTKKFFGKALYFQEKSYWQYMKAVKIKFFICEKSTLQIFNLALLYVCEINNNKLNLGNGEMRYA